MNQNINWQKWFKWCIGGVWIFFGLGNIVSILFFGVLVFATPLEMKLVGVWISGLSMLAFTPMALFTGFRYMRTTDFRILKSPLGAQWYMNPFIAVFIFAIGMYVWNGENKILQAESIASPTVLQALDGKYFYYSTETTAKDGTPLRNTFALEFSHPIRNTIYGWWDSDWHNKSRISGCPKVTGNEETTDVCFTAIAEGELVRVLYQCTGPTDVGEAIAAYNEKTDTLTWKVDKESGGDCYVPTSAVLSNQTDNPCRGIPDGMCRE